MCLLHCCGEILEHSDLHYCFSSATLEDQISSRILSWDFDQPSFWFCMSHADLDLLVGFGSWSFCITQITRDSSTIFDSRIYGSIHYRKVSDDIFSNCLEILKMFFGKSEVCSFWSAIFTLEIFHGFDVSYLLLKSQIQSFTHTSQASSEEVVQGSLVNRLVTVSCFYISG